LDPAGVPCYVRDTVTAWQSCYITI
jgi:hypothetical protein